MNVKGYTVEPHYYHGPSGLAEIDLNSEMTVLVGLAMDNN